MNRLLTIIIWTVSLTLLLFSCDKEETIQIELNQGNAIDNNLISGSGTSSFMRIIGGVKLDAFHSVRQTSEGGYIFCGFTENRSATERDIMLLKTNNQGETEWIITFSDDYSDQGWNVQQTNDNGFIIAAISSSKAKSKNTVIPYSGQLLKTNSKGELQWKMEYSFGTFTAFTGVQHTSDGGFIVAGTEYSSNEGFLLKTDASGNEMWRKTFGNYKEFSHIELTSDGGYIICGTNQVDPIKQIDIYILRTDINGDTLWTSTFGDNYDNAATSIQETANGYLVSGYNLRTSKGASGFITMIDSQGVETWTKEYQSNNIRAIDFVNLTIDSELIAVGRESFGSNSKAFLLKVSSKSGDVLWQKSFETGSYNSLHEVHQSTDNGYIIAGYTKNSGNGNGYIIKTDENGN